MNTLRISALRAVIDNRPLKEFAEEHDLDASYLSQLLNGHRRLGEKAAAKMERQIGLIQGTLVNPGIAEQPAEIELEAPVSAFRVLPGPEEHLLRKLREAHKAASPTSQKVLSRLIAAAEKHSISDEAWLLIGNLLTELEKR